MTLYRNRKLILNQKLKTNLNNEKSLSNESLSSNNSAKNHLKLVNKIKEKKFCLFYNRFGRCSRGDTCPFIHDPKRVALCPRSAFLLILVLY